MQKDVRTSFESGIGTSGALNIPKGAISFFSKDEKNFTNLIDALAVGDLGKATRIGTSAGLTAKQAALLGRDSAALAGLVASVGEIMDW
jgi:hypothetical protein